MALLKVKFIGNNSTHFSATFHRVKNNKDQMRVSWPMFLGPNLNRDLTQLIEFKWNEKQYIGRIYLKNTVISL